MSRDLRSLTITLFVVGVVSWAVCVVALAKLLHDSNVSRPAHVELIDSTYAVLVGRDSLTVLEGVKAVSRELDSICITLSGEEC